MKIQQFTNSFNSIGIYRANKPFCWAVLNPNRQFGILSLKMVFKTEN